MAKADKIHEARMQGMYYAFNAIKKDGLEAFAKELQFRQAFGVTLYNSQKELKEYADTIINRSMQVILVFAVATMHDEFGFGQVTASISRIPPGGGKVPCGGPVRIRCRPWCLTYRSQPQT